MMAGTSRANLEIGAEVSIDVAAEPVVCEARDPNACSAPPEVTGFADSVTPFNAEQFHGRVLVVRNTGRGALLLKPQGERSLDGGASASGACCAPGRRSRSSTTGPRRAGRSSVVGRRPCRVTSVTRCHSSMGTLCD